VGAPLQNTAMMRVPNLKAGRSRRVLAGNNPVTFTDHTGLQPGAYGLSDYSPGAALNFSDALGLLSQLGGQYRSSALMLQALDNQGLLRINDPWLGNSANAETIGYDNGKYLTGKASGLKLPVGINVKSSLVQSASDCDKIKANPDTRFEFALLLAGTLHHERKHWSTYSKYSNKEPMANKAELDFYRDFFFQELKAGASSERLNSIWRVGTDRRDAIRESGYYDGPSIFDHGSQFDF
jgi:hypothetical protein